MKHNVGGMDRKMRLLGGSILVLIGLFAPLGTGWQIGIAAVGAIAIITGFTGFCPLSQIIGINTYQEGEEK